MNQNMSGLLAGAALLLATLVGGCAASKGAAPAVFDLGPLNAIPATIASTAPMATPATTTPISTFATIAPLTVADVTSASWLDSLDMHYRLDYQDARQPRPYAASRWSMPPPQLLGQRIKARLAQAGVAVLSNSDGAVNMPTLRIEADDFSQRFSGPASSDVHVALRASVLSGRLLVAQKSFEQVRTAPTADAAGGAQAIAGATDVVITDLLTWLASLPRLPAKR